jgi:alpha-1,2-mannosyltransferase
VVAALAGAAALFLTYVPAHRGWFDVGVYHGAVGYWLRDGGHLYDYLRPGTSYGFTYPPFAALLMSPLLLLDWHPAVAASVVVNVAAGAAVTGWLLGPVAERHHWPRWYSFGLVGCAVAVFEPVRDTVSFGQVNLVLLALVLADVRLAGGRWHRLAGVGTGLAAAVKLTPAVFILFLLVTRRWRAAAVATGTAATATGLTALLAPDASRVFWTSALWNTSRVGDLGYVSNQSLRGVLARLDPDPGAGVWVASVVVVLVVWAVRVRRTDLRTGVALTGTLGCLVSPVTWVHHLVWLLPALAVLADHALAAGHRARRRRLLAATALAYLLLCSSVVWLWWDGGGGPVAFVGANTYVWITLALLVGLPLGEVGQQCQVGQGEPVAVHPEADDHPGGHRRDDRVVPELLPGVDV